MEWKNKIYNSILEHQFKTGGGKSKSPRQMKTGELKSTIIKDIQSEHELRKKGKNTKDLDKRISGFVKDFEKTRSRN